MERELAKLAHNITSVWKQVRIRRNLRFLLPSVNCQKRVKDGLVTTEREKEICWPSIGSSSNNTVIKLVRSARSRYFLALRCKWNSHTKLVWATNEMAVIWKSQVEIEAVEHHIYPTGNLCLGGKTSHYKGLKPFLSRTSYTWHNISFQSDKMGNSACKDFVGLSKNSSSRTI